MRKSGPAKHRAELWHIRDIYGFMGLVFPKLNQLTNHFTPVLNAHFFMPHITLQVNVAENNRILRDEERSNLAILVPVQYLAEKRSGSKLKLLILS